MAFPTVPDFTYTHSTRERKPHEIREKHMEFYPSFGFTASVGSEHQFKASWEPEENDIGFASSTNSEKAVI